MYKLIKNRDGITYTIFRIIDKASIPCVLDNTDYQEYLKWLEEGNTPLQADEISE
jgi:hypothetical protein